MKQCVTCGGYWGDGSGKPEVCSVCVSRGEKAGRATERREPVLRVAPRADGYPRLYYGYMNLMTQEKGGIVEVHVGDPDIKTVLRAFAEAKGGVYQDDEVVLTAVIPVEALVSKVAA